MNNSRATTIEKKEAMTPRITTRVITDFYDTQSSHPRHLQGGDVTLALCAIFPAES